uniref:Uncharacterized protein n=1 Tax=Sphaerodactylus townsendi TaxID=933632 RepID=A0ACB8GEX8_9SAUR
MHLCAISLDRYIAIRNPIHHSRFNSRTKVFAKIIAVWTVSAVVRNTTKNTIDRMVHLISTRAAHIILKKISRNLLKAADEVFKK